MKETVAIVYGFAEGPKIGKKLIQTLPSYNLTLTKNISEAHYIIVHSGGIYTLPKMHTAQHILIDAPSIGGNTSTFEMQIQKVIIDFVHSKNNKKTFRWINQSFWNFYYLFKHLPYNLKMLHNYKKELKTFPRIHAPKITVINHQHDPWAKRINANIKNKFPHYTFLLKPGVHDDIWHNPHEYIRILLNKKNVK